MVAKLLLQPVDRLRLPSFNPLVAATATIVLMTTIVRCRVGADQPLWLDETFTGAIAALPSLADVLHQSLLDVNAPLYYVIAHAWSSVFGLSNQALRAPALLCGCLAPLLCLIPARSLSRPTRLVWCASVALWAPGLDYAREARCYSPLLCLSILGTVLFARLLERPDLRRAAAWSLVGCLAILTHYYALVLVGCQGVAFLAVGRTRALRTWPAALLFGPAFAWLALHVPRIATFAAPNVAWYRPLALMDLTTILDFLTGTLVAVGLMAGLWAWAWIRVSLGDRRAAAPAGAANDNHGHGAWSAWVAVGCACAGAAVVVALAYARPTLALRYMVPFVPGVLLGLALGFERLRAVWTLAPGVLVLLLAASWLVAAAGACGPRNVYNFQGASEALIEARTRDLIFFWDHPATLVEDPSQLAIVGGFFFQRRGVDVHVTPFKVARHEDPNPGLAALARKSGTAILWLYDKAVHDTAATRFPPRIEALADSVRCHDYGEAPVGVVACLAKPPR